MTRIYLCLLPVFLLVFITNIRIVLYEFSAWVGFTCSNCFAGSDLFKFPSFGTFSRLRVSNRLYCLVSWWLFRQTDRTTCINSKYMLVSCDKQISPRASQLFVSRRGGCWRWFRYRVLFNARLIGQPFELSSNIIFTLLLVWIAVWEVHVDNLFCGGSVSLDEETARN